VGRKFGLLVIPTFVSHRNIIAYCNRPFATVSEMNKALIDNWNKVVRKGDKVIMNGDFALSGKDKIIEIGQQLNGHKTLVLGNHDGASLKTYYDAGFEMVSKYPIVVGEFFIVSHMPQYIQENGVYANIFAHVHTNPMYKSVSSRSFCVSAERINYTPISFEIIKKQMEDYKDVEKEEDKEFL
jgi:calcineurin-like phosphoesterase family protein